MELLMRVIIISPDKLLSEELNAAAEKKPGLEVLRVFSDYPEVEELLRIIRVRKPDCLFLSFNDFEQFRTLAASIDTQMFGLPVIAIGNVGQSDLIPKLMQVGVR